MILRFLRRRTVRNRIAAGVLFFIVISSLGVPLTLSSTSSLSRRLEEITGVNLRAIELLLTASEYVTSSRANLLRYRLDYAPSPYEARDDAQLAVETLTEARALVSPDDQPVVDELLQALDDYQLLIDTVERANTPTEASRAEFEAYRLSNDIRQRIDILVKDERSDINLKNQQAVSEARRRLNLLLTGYLAALLLAAMMGRLLLISVVNPVEELRQSAERMRKGELDVRVPLAGRDELTRLAETFNQMAADLGEIYQQLENRVAERTRELTERSRYLEASARVAQAASSILNREELMRQVVDLIRDHFDLYYVGLFEIDPTNEWAVLRAGTGEAGQTMLARRHRLRLDGASMIAWSIRNRKARIALQAGEDPIRLATPELPQTRSEAAIPIHARGEVIGALTVQDDEPNAFNEDIITTLQTMANQIGVALDNARLFEEVQQSLRAAERAYAGLSREAWQLLLQMRQDLAYSEDAERGLAPLETPSLQPEERLALEEGRPVLGSQGADEGVPLAIPIKVRDQVIGVLDAIKDGDQDWTEEEIQLLQTITDQLGSALDSARLFLDTQRRAARERLVTEITTKIRATTDPQTMLETAVRELRQALRSRRAQIVVQTNDSESAEETS